MKLQCPCGKWHDMSPTALAIVVSAFARGDMQRVTDKGIRVFCFRSAFTSITAKHMARSIKPNQTISIDGQHWSMLTKDWQVPFNVSQKTTG